MSTIPRGFSAAHYYGSAFKGHKPVRLGLWVSAYPCSAAGIFTRNAVKAAPVLVSQKHLKNKKAQAILINSGCANAGTGTRGLNNARESARLVGRCLNIPATGVLLGSTGVIGTHLPMNAMRKGIHELCRTIGNKPHTQDRAFTAAATAILTTDTHPKIAHAMIPVKNATIRIWACAKGAGMIAPDLATMLSVFITDAGITSSLLNRMLTKIIAPEFNMIMVDGDTSTNDTVYLCANSASGINIDRASAAVKKRFCNELGRMAKQLAGELVADGEGAQHAIRVDVQKARNHTEAVSIARTIASSPLVKTAVAGNDPNWGRVLAAVGRAGVPVNPMLIDIYFNGTRVCCHGQACSYNEKKLVESLRKKQCTVRVVLNQGNHAVRCLTCDFTEEYVRINAEYRT
ncbi:MAG: bifunctional glutamate N-acetyltransferase/amino-acid acetyltransferase ArgJ [Elusimicrobia bacterium]|nr:bifunctional glutamate N-acetyltransferase/amino-acid acetyltransferase ArgJ [Elusimicrobiota bacterium]MBD3411638.1 bifunctional glutamate N-acetyltransferase/amino-acid acetyltransferase ArgJ [Elusimicrobiota bacterium]